MPIQYSDGTGKLYFKGIEKPAADVRYHLLTIPSNRFNASKWWGTLSSNKEIRNAQDVILEFENRARGEIFLFASGRLQANGRYPYTFNGHGRLKGVLGQASSV